MGELKILLSVLGSLYLLLLLSLFFWQERFIFQPKPLDSGYVYDFDAHFEEVWIPVEETVSLNGLFFPAAGPRKGSILYLHGNRGNLSRWGQVYDTFLPHGYDVLVFDYRGYGKSNGKPTEAGLYADADAAMQWLLQRCPAGEIVIYGRSLGSGIAAYLASRYAARLLVLETPYDEMPNVIRGKVPAPLPDALFRHRFPTIDFLAEAKCPAHIFAGTQDKLVPIWLSERLIPLLSSPSCFYAIEGGGHRNLRAFAEYQFRLGLLLGPVE